MDSSISKPIVNFEQVVIVLIKWWWLLVSILILSLSLGFVYTKMADKKYTVRTVFFVPSMGGAKNPLLNYGALLTGSGPSDDIRPYIDSLVKSRRMQMAIGKSLQPQFPTHSMEVLLSKDLKLSTKLRLSSDKQTGVFVLNYSHINPKIAVMVSRSCLASLNQFNRELDVSPKTHIITIIDYPEIPLYPSWPNFSRIMVFSFLGGLFVGVTLVFLIEFIIYLRKKFKDKPLNEHYLCN